MARIMNLSLLIIGTLLAISTQVANVNAHDGDDNRRCSDCTNCCNNNRKEKKKGCVSGDMHVEEQSRGIIRVSQLSDGDFIRGISGADRKPGWCRVEAVYPSSYDKVTTYEGFTANHMVVDDDSVHQFGEKGNATENIPFKLATECDAALNTAGQVFTPISTAFCPHDLAWSEYLTLMGAIRRVTDRTGFFWYFSDAFYDNDTAHIPQWMDMLHEMCLELLSCARDGKCQQFENVMAEFVREHVNKKYVYIVDVVFPNMGGDVSKEEAGTISETVRPKETRSILLISAVGSAIVGFLLVLLVAAILYRKRYSRGNKKLQDLQAKHPQVNADDEKA
ncbi:uncharacterized protein [Pocillopora verrucosa]|uniref:uncharacterized protein n=1 Tax=Pocillopora verrucosa TaxID=203993 RepID=UPI00333ED2F4